MTNQYELPSGVFTRADLASSGTTPALLRQALAAGFVRRLLRGVFVAAEIPDSTDLRLAAVARAVTPGHVACDRTAAWIHGVDVLDSRDAQFLPPVEICALRWNPATTRREIRGRNRDLLDVDYEDRGGLLVTTPLRTALDLGCVLRRRDALAALDQFRRKFGIAEQELSHTAVRYFRRRGVVQLRSLIPLSDPLSESVRESWTRLAILEAGLPAPVPQFEIEVDGEVIIRLDLAYPARWVAVEYDGEEFHSTDDQLLHDGERRDWLKENGWHVIVVRRGDFTGRRLDAWIEELRTALNSPYTNLRW